MSAGLAVSVEELVATARERKARIPPEIGAFVALEVCEALLQGPALVRPSDVHITPAGVTELAVRPGSASSQEAARSVVALLAALLVAAGGTGVPRALMALVDGPLAGDLASLRDELEASLVPLNRAAARRVLSRMLREVRRPRSIRPAETEPRPPQDATLDAQLGALLDGQGISLPPRAPTLAERDSDLDATLFDGDAPTSRGGDSDDATLFDGDAPTSRGGDSDDAALHDASSPEHETSLDDPSHDAPPETTPAATSTRSRALGRAGASRSSRPHDVTPLLEGRASRNAGGPSRGLLFAVALVLATAAGVALLRPDLIDAALGRAPAPASDPEPSLEERADAARLGTLHVEVSTPRAQVLLFVGRGPATAHGLRLGVAHEFVAIADGRRPTRATIPADARWETEETGRRYELALRASTEPSPELEIGPSELVPEVDPPTGALGSVHVITSPPGVKVYRLVGFGPRATVEHVRTDEAIELLVGSPGGTVERVLVGPSDWQLEPDGSRHARITAAPLPPDPAR